MTAGEAVAFKQGDVVRVAGRAHPGHHRVPLYIKGRKGVVERLLTQDRNPEQLAYGGNGLPRHQVYQVRFGQRDLWPDYPGGSGDTLTVDILEHWLEPGDTEGGQA